MIFGILNSKDKIYCYFYDIRFKSDIQTSLLKRLLRKLPQIYITISLLIDIWTMLKDAGII